jgi:hypothetical protein
MHLESWLKKYPWRVFGGFALFHLSVWVLLPSIFHPNPPFDLIETATWGTHFQWGYEKHPPLSSWIVGAAMWVSNYSLWVYYLLSQICVIISFYFIWKLAELIIPKAQPLLAALLLEGVYYYNLTSYEFNPNVLQLPLWAAFCYVFYLAVHKGGLHFWVLSAVIAALGILAKYYFALLLLGALAVLIFTKEGRVFFKSGQPYVALLIFLTILAPHMHWLANHEASSISYALERDMKQYTLYHHLLYPLRFFLTQTLAVLGLLLVVGATFGLKRNKALYPKKGFPAHYICLMCAVPFAANLLFALVTGMKIKSMWGTPLWGLAGIAAFLLLKPALEQKRIRRMMIGIISVGVLYALIYPNLYIHVPHPRAHFPGKDLHEKVESMWEKHFEGPIPYIAGDLWLAGNISFFSEGQTDSFIELDSKKSPWATVDALKAKGGIIMWARGYKDTGTYPRYKEVQHEFISHPESVELESTHPKAEGNMWIELRLVPPSKHYPADIY